MRREGVLSMLFTVLVIMRPRPAAPALLWMMTTNKDAQKKNNKKEEPAQTNKQKQRTLSPSTFSGRSINNLLYAYVSMHVYICVHACMYVYMYLYVYVYVCMCASIWFVRIPESNNIWFRTLALRRTIIKQQSTNEAKRATKNKQATQSNGKQQQR